MQIIPSKTAQRASRRFPALPRESADASRLLGDPHSFDIHEFSDAVGGEFAAVAGTFYTAERDACVGGGHFVDEDHAGFEFVDEALAFGGVGGPGAGAEAEAAVVGEADGFVNIFDAEQGGDGTEEFFAIGGRFFRDVG